MSFKINPDITKAETLPATFYKDPVVFETIKEKFYLNNNPYPYEKINYIICSKKCFRNLKNFF